MSSPIYIFIEKSLAISLSLVVFLCLTIFIAMKKLFYIALFSVSIVLAHPHVFIDVGAGLNFSGQKLTGIDIEWIFDQMYSYDIISSLTDGDMTVDDSEREDIEALFAKSFGTLSYLTVIERKGQRLDIQEILDFDMVIREDMRVVISFTIPYYINVADGSETINLSFHDESLYHGLTPQKGTPEFNGAEQISTTVKARNSISFDITMEPK